LLPAMFIAVSFQVTLVGIQTPFSTLLQSQDTHR
jgi:hypothetical protein